MNQQLHEAVSDDSVQGGVQTGGGSVAVCGCFAYTERDLLVELAVRLNHHFCTRVLDRIGTVSFVHHLTGIRSLHASLFRGVNFQVHRTKPVTHYVDQHAEILSHLAWPAMSPDLNLIKKIWTIWNNGVASNLC